ncbi:MAG: hypothetical protein FVQ82_10280 [Planctomycetes bacterium]|nr:hypothetical protein [Planctomycetota bacterium]
MDPKRIYELILSGSKASDDEVYSGFDVSEIIDEFAVVNRAVKELENAVGDFESQTGFNNDFTAINRKMQTKKMALEFEGVDAAYEM